MIDLFKRYTVSVLALQAEEGSFAGERLAYDPTIVARIAALATIQSNQRQRERTGGFSTTSQEFLGAFVYHRIELGDGWIGVQFWFCDADNFGDKTHVAKEAIQQTAD